jgi:hypothetical protein
MPQGFFRPRPFFSLLLVHCIEYTRVPLRQAGFSAGMRPGTEFSQESILNKEIAPVNDAGERVS